VASWQHRHAAGARGDVDALGEERHRRAPGIGQESDPTGARNDLQRHLHQLTGYPLDALRHPGHVAARPRIVREEIGDARIGEREADDRQHRRDPFERDGGAGRVGHQDVRLERDQFLRQRLELFDVAVAMVDIQVATLRIAQAAQAIDEGEVHALLRTQRQECDAGAGVGRAGRQRQRKHHARKRRHASSPTHSITSSARSNIDVGIVTPIALAV
jgi:hypothetical protein